jgi:DNA-directed RNA polymerase specialized sigma24 family protein
MNEIRCKICKVENANLEKGLCPICIEIETLQESIAQKLRTYLHDAEPEKAILENIDELAELSKESQWQQCKQTIIDTMTSEQLNQKTAWRLFVKLQSIEGQTQHLEDWEKETIVLLRKVMKFSYETIAFILGRSKETIHRHVEATER